MLKVKILNDFTGIMLEDLLIFVSFLDKVFIRKDDNLGSTDGVGDWWF